MIKAHKIGRFLEVLCMMIVLVVPPTLVQTIIIGLKHGKVQMLLAHEAQVGTAFFIHAICLVFTISIHEMWDNKYLKERNV